MSENEKDSQFDNIPKEVVLDILERGNLDEIEGLCKSDKSFLSMCNALAERKIRDRYQNNMYGLFLDLEKLKKYSVMFIPTHEEHTPYYATVSNEDELLDTLKTWLTTYVSGVRYAFNTDLSFNSDNLRRPRFVIMTLSNITDHTYKPSYDVSIVIQGPFKNHAHVEDIVSKIWDDIRER